MWNAGRKAKVNQLDSSFSFVKQNVLKLDVTVSHVSLVQVMDAEDHLLPEKLGFDLGHLSVGLTLQIAMQGATIDVFHDQEHLLVRLKRLKKFG